jgi:hypothetical protein
MSSVPTNGIIGEERLSTIRRWTEAESLLITDITVLANNCLFECSKEIG